LQQIGSVTGQKPDQKVTVLTNVTILTVLGSFWEGFGQARGPLLQYYQLTAFQNQAKNRSNVTKCDHFYVFYAHFGPFSRPEKARCCMILTRQPPKKWISVTKCDQSDQSDHF
jgi:hypothetical protein